MLRKYDAKQLPFLHGGDATDATALFQIAAQMAHSCAPNVTLDNVRLPQTPGENVRGDGRLVGTAAVDVEPGDALTINYGPKGLLHWPLERRRRYLRETRGFECGCARCSLEDAARVAR